MAKAYIVQDEQLETDGQLQVIDGQVMIAIQNQHKTTKSISIEYVFVRI